MYQKIASLASAQYP